MINFMLCRFYNKKIELKRGKIGMGQELGGNWDISFDPVSYTNVTEFEK